MLKKDMRVNDMDNELSKELEQILNQHGWDAFVDYVGDRIERSYQNGYDVGRDDGWCEAYDTFVAED